jgi:hypothetical protein
VLDVVVVIAVLDHLALAVEVQHRHSRVGEFLTLLGPASLQESDNVQSVRETTVRMNHVIMAFGGKPTRTARRAGD